EPSLRYEHRAADRVVGGTHTNGGITSAELRRALQNLNQTPEHLPSIADFAIDEDDIADFVSIVEESCRRMREYEEEYGAPTIRARNAFFPDCDSREAFLS